MPDETKEFYIIQKMYEDLKAKYKSLHFIWYDDGCIRIINRTYHFTIDFNGIDNIQIVHHEDHYNGFPNWKKISMEKAEKLLNKWNKLQNFT